MVQHAVSKGLLPKTCSKLVLLAVSAAIYYWVAYDHFLTIVAATLITYALALAIDSVRGSRKKAYLAVGVILCVALLGLFKYLDYFVGLAFLVLGKDGFDGFGLIQPLGISFWRFPSSRTSSMSIGEPSKLTKAC